MKKDDKLPAFLDGVDKRKYNRWLNNRVTSHCRRFNDIDREKCKREIHQAVIKSQGKDAYTDEELKWTLIGEYKNEESRKQGREYKKQFAPLPTVDHNWEKGTCEFKICSWRTNDAKNDLSYNDFLELCKGIIAVANSRL